MATLRVVLDTHVLLSGIAYTASVLGKIPAAWRHGSVEVLLSDYIGANSVACCPGSRIGTG